MTALVLMGEDRLTPQEALMVQLGLFVRALDIISKKRHDYSGSRDPFANLRMAEFVGVEPWRGVLVRRMDKISRRRHILEAGQAEVSGESLLDTLVDEINYLAIEAGLLLEKPPLSSEVAGLMEDARRLPEMAAKMIGDAPKARTR